MLRQIQNKRMLFSSSNLITSYACRINTKRSIDFTIGYRIFSFKRQICYYETNNLHQVIKRLTTYWCENKIIVFQYQIRYLLIHIINLKHFHLNVYISILYLPILYFGYSTFIVYYTRYLCIGIYYIQLLHVVMNK